jgi:hypothetical protein
MLKWRIESRQWHRSDAGEAHCNSSLAGYTPDRFAPATCV